MKKIFSVASLVLLVFCLAPSFAHAYGTYDDCVAVKNQLITDKFHSTGSSSYSINEGTRATILYKVITECNALPDAPTVVPSNMNLNSTQIKMVGYVVVDPFQSGDPLQLNPFIVKVTTQERLIPDASWNTALNTPLIPKQTTPPTDNSGNPTNPGDSNQDPIISGGTPSNPPVNNPISCPPSDETYLVNQIATLKASNTDLQNKNNSLTTQNTSLQLQVSGKDAQIANLTAQLAQANAKIKAISNVQTTETVKTETPVVTTPTVQTIEIPDVTVTVPPPTQVKKSTVEKFTTWVANIFR